MGATGATGLLQEAPFTLLDYALFAGLLLASALTGVYFCVRSRGRPADVRGYLMGGRNLDVFPVAMSLMGSYISGVTVVGTPAEIYNTGTQYCFIVVSILVSGALVIAVYQPVFMCLNLSSSYEYLELRFDKSLRFMASILFLFDEILFLPVLVYTPALAFNQVTGVNILVIGGSMCVICIFYTVLGGLQAVVWTDTWQVSVMMGSTFVVSIIGVVKAGGFEPIFEYARDTDRLILFDFDTNTDVRYSFWSVFIGGTVYWTAFNAVNQTMVQRYMSLSTRRKAAISTAIFSVGAFLMVGMCCFIGLIIYEHFGGCDPKTSGQLQTDDQLMPAYISLTSKNIPGLPGIFIAGVFGAALSSMSVILNSAATVVLEDIVCGLCKTRPSPKWCSIIARSTVVFLGLYTLCALLLMEYLQGVLNVATSFSAIATSSAFGMFSLGMLCPWATPAGSLAGAIAGAVMSGWAAAGGQYASATGFYPPDLKSPSLANCTAEFNATNVWPTLAEPADPSEFLSLHKMSYLYIAPLGLFSSLVVGMLVSLCTSRKPLLSMDPELFSPVIHRFLPKEMMKNAGLVANRKKSPEDDNSSSIQANTGMLPGTTLLLTDSKIKNNSQPKR